MNNRVLSYLQGEVRKKYQNLREQETPEEKLLVLHDIKELKRHISVIEML